MNNTIYCLHLWIFLEIWERFVQEYGLCFEIQLQPLCNERGLLYFRRIVTHSGCLRFYRNLAIYNNIIATLFCMCMNVWSIIFFGNWPFWVWIFKNELKSWNCMENSNLIFFHQIQCFSIKFDVFSSNFSALHWIQTTYIVKNVHHNAVTSHRN